MKIVITGGSGGIGLAIVKRCIQHYLDAEIIATYNSSAPEFQHQRLQWFQLDLTNEQQIQTFARQFTSIEILINAAGLLHLPEHRPEKSLKEFDIDFFEQNIAINTRSSILLAKHFTAALKSKNNTFFLALSARVGSISDNKLGGWLSYRTAKAALNMAIKTISIEWRHKLPNCCILLFHPGTTDTPLSQPFHKNLAQGQLHSAEMTANSLLTLIDSMTPNDSGQFVDFNHQEIDW